MGEALNGHKDVVACLMNKTDNGKMYNILVIIDDYADKPAFTRNSKLLHALLARASSL